MVSSIKSDTFTSDMSSDIHSPGQENSIFKH